VCIDNESANNENFHWNDKAWNINADITDYKVMKNAFTNVNYVFHLAAESRLQPAIENPIQAVHKNCVGTATILQYAPVIGIFQRQKESGESLTLVGDGSQKRDFIHVEDVARANYIAATADLGDYIGEVFNIGSGKNYSIKDIADAISDNQVSISKRNGEMETTLADISKVESVMNWKPEIDVLEWIYGQK
jgi:nucleoside-diphosphate-sugar epimerase